ncbi:NACHT domain-containing protein [Streptomyces sp. NPDC092952]|uniref:NACHT domain-containing protein n=1 Tax=Streptomyces sp. NPDC092952 TaxID=3366018 RepID=UPI0037F7CB03
MTRAELQKERLALIRGGDDDRFRSVGTGYLIAPRLVLTAHHVVQKSDGSKWERIEVRVGHPQDGGTYRSVLRGSVCWTAPDNRDAALLLLDNEVDAPGIVLWGRPAGRTPLPYEGLGYPYAAYKGGQHRVEHLRGELPPLAGGTGAQDLCVLDQGPTPVSPTDGERPWVGASGTAVFCQNRLVGVVIHDDKMFANSRLHACPARTFVDDPEFIEHLRHFGGGPPALVDVRGVGHGTTDDHRPSRRPRTRAEALHALGRAVRTGLENDPIQKEVESGEPLPLHCRAASRKITGQRDGARETSVALARTSPLDLTGQLSGLVAVYLWEKRGKLLILGKGGSGKSVLVRRFAQNLLEKANPAGQGPVPVIFSLGSWNPTHMYLKDWLIDRLERDYPFLARRTGEEQTTWAAELMTEGDVLAVLDGFDEMAPNLYEPALQEIKTSNLPILLTSRPEPLKGIEPDGGLFPGIELTGLTLADCSARLGDLKGWPVVLKELRNHPDAPAVKQLTTALATPLMFTMVTDFCKSGGTPASLLELARSDTSDTSDTLEWQLLNAFFRRAYNDKRNPSVPLHQRWSAEKAGDWLRYLAEHLEKQGSGSEDIEWWRLGTTMSLPLRMAVSGSLCGLVSGTASAAVAMSAGSLALASLTMLVNVLGIGAAFGILHGFTSTVKVNALFTPSRMQIATSSEPRGKRWGRVRESFLLRTGGGLVGGLIFGTVYGGALAVYVSLQSFSLLSVALIFGNWLVAGLMLGVGLGIVLTLVAWFETEATPNESVGATDLLRKNRTIVLVQAATAGLVLGLGYGAAVTHFNGFALGLQSGITGGLAAAFGILTLTAWGRWMALVRLWLPLRGTLPWRMSTFLEDARARGVLRQVGAVYQFRHTRLKEHLTDSGRPS